MLPLMMRSKGKLPWYRAGNIPIENCIAAYKPKGATSYALSKVNQVRPGTYDLVDGAAFPTWAIGTGWTFAAALSQYLTVASALVTDVPLSMVCRFNPVGVATNYRLLSICDTAASNRFYLLAAGVTAGDPVSAYLVSSVPAAGGANSTAGFTAGSWYTGAAVYIAINSRAAYLNGGNKGTDATAITPTGIDTTIIGAQHDGTAVNGFFDGSMAACAFYNIALSDAQVAALHAAMALL